MSDPHFFGYGSLVNRTTHEYALCRPARLSGWRRTWRSTPHRAAAFLTAAPDPVSQISGLIAAVPGADWRALDLRETGYERIATDAVHHDHPARPDIAVYAVPEAGWTSAPLPILLSYLDVVVQGYLVEFGVEGVAEFFATTDGWDAPIADDRAAPLYPRARALTDAETALVDNWLERLNSRRIDPVTSGLAEALRSEA